MPIPHTAEQRNINGDSDVQINIQISHTNGYDHL